MDEKEVQEKVDSCLSRLMIWDYLYKSDVPPDIAKRKITLLEDTAEDVQDIIEFCIVDKVSTPP